jgi:hypothetical protein
MDRETADLSLTTRAVLVSSTALVVVLSGTGYRPGGLVDLDRSILGYRVAHDRERGGR